VDIRFGIKDYGPFDLQSPRAPKEIRIGLVGTAETTEGAARWIESVCEGFRKNRQTSRICFPHSGSFFQ